MRHQNEISFLVVVPVYNHASSIREVAERVLALDYPLLVVDDGSSDTPLDCLEGLDVMTIKHETNQGKGAAILTGVKKAKELGKTHLIGIDGDGQHSPEDIEKILPVIKEHPHSLVLGARIFEGQDVPGSSKFGRRFANFWYRVHTGSTLDDTQSGFRAYPISIFDHLPLWTRRYAFDFEILVRMKQAGGDLIEVPISVKYGEDRVTHIRLFVDNLRVSLLNTYFTFRRLLFFIPHKKLPAEERQDNKNWDSKSLGAKWQYQFFFMLIKVTGRRGAYAFMYFVTAWYVLFNAKVKENAKPYLTRRFKWKYSLWDTYRLVTEQGKVLVDRSVLGILGDDQFQKKYNRMEGVKELLDKDKGLIILMSHVGCWKLSLAGLSKFGVPAAAVLYRVEGDHERDFFEHRKEKSPFRVIDPTSDFGGTLEMLDSLKKKEILCMMGDRMMGKNRHHCDVDFLGEKARFPTTAFKLASLTGAPVLCLYSFKTAPNQFDYDLAKVIYVPEKSGMKTEEYLPYVKEYVATLEDFVEKHPYMYFNFYNIWDFKNGVKQT